MIKEPASTLALSTMPIQKPILSNTGVPGTYMRPAKGAVSRSVVAATRVSIFSSLPFSIYPTSFAQLVRLTRMCSVIAQALRSLRAIKAHGRICSQLVRMLSASPSCPTCSGHTKTVDISRTGAEQEAGAAYSHGGKRDGMTTIAWLPMPKAVSVTALLFISHQAPFIRLRRVSVKI